jgi:hypothetical protein
MGFASLIRGGIALASGLTSDLQANVIHTPWVAEDGYGKMTPGIPVTRKALVDRKVTERYANTGKLVMTLATITFLDPIAPNGASGRIEPIDPRDILTLDDGATAPIVEISAFEDAGVQAPYLNEVTLGTIIG